MDIKQFKRSVKQSNKMNSFLKKVSKTNTFKQKKGQSIEDKKELALQKIGTFEDL